MKKILTLILFVSFSSFLLAQKNDHFFFLETDTTWRKEMFVFPINFAPDINYEGREDARFPEGWEEQDSPNFWSYAFAWNIEHNKNITESILEADLQKYFNGLMRWDKTTVEIDKKEEANNKTSYTGAVKTTDAFFTKEPMTLNVKAEEIYCPEKKKSIILFRFSPKEFDAAVWQKLGEVKLPNLIANCGETKAKKIHDLVNSCSEYGQFNGSVLVAEKGEVIYKNGFGLANMEWDVPNQTNTKHRLASVSKQFTAMLIVQLAAENKLKLDAPITKYLPDYPKETGDKITTHHLLTHTAGIPNYTSFPNYRDIMRDPYSPMEIMNLYKDLPLEFNPGEKFAYSNSGYVLLGIIIEKLTGKTFEQALQDQILRPLKMNNTGYDKHSTILKNRATGYNKNANDYMHSSYIDMSLAYTAGALYSTVEDLYLWDQALYTEKMLPQKYMDLLFEKHSPAWRGHYGYGWEISNMPIGNTKEQLEAISHGGFVNGFNTQITRIPSDQSVIILLNNTGGAPLFDMTAAIIGILKNKTFTAPQPSLAHSLLDSIEENGLAIALSQYKEMKASGDYHLDENEMNLSGYKLLGEESIEEAAAVFKLNVEAFENSFNVYDSYGEVLLMQGDTMVAIENYKRSVQLNPNNENGIKILEGLGIDTKSLIVKVPVERLKLLAGEYQAIGQNREWKIVIEELNGELFGNDGGYRYQLNPVGEDKFINPDDGATVVFDAKDENAITFVIFGRVKFEKSYK